jgi:hypothetical protein
MTVDNADDIEVFYPKITRTIDESLVLILIPLATYLP